MIYRKTHVIQACFIISVKKSNSDIRLLFFCPINAIINSVISFMIKGITESRHYNTDVAEENSI